MRVAFALLVKELQQHAPALMGAAVLCAVGAVVTWTMALEERWVTLLSAAHGLVGFVLPLLALFVAERLVVQDHQAGTHEFLAALPISPGLRAAIRFGMGLAVVLSAGLLVLLTTALLAQRREGVPLSFLASLAVLHAGYLFAWFGLAFGIAHLGRYRWLVWWLLFVSVPMAEAFLEEPSETLYWFGLVMDGAEKARMAPPWSALPLALLWGGMGTVLGLAVSTWRGGWLLERFFRPVTADERARLIGIGVAGMLLSSVFEDQAPQKDAWSTLPAAKAQRATVRIAASEGSLLWEVGTEAAGTLDALGEALDIDAWPPIVLLRARPETGESAVTVAPTGEDSIARVLLVDLDQPKTELVRQIVTEATAHELAGLSDWDPDARWLTCGLASWWLAPSQGDTALLARRAARGVGRAELATRDWLSVERDLGPTFADAVAWAGLVALEEQGGRESVLAVARAVLRPHRRPAWPSGARLRFTTRGDFVGRVGGVDRARLATAWEEVMRRAHSDTTLEELVLPALAVEALEGEMVVSWEGELPPDIALEWLSLDPLQEAPLPSDQVERIVPDDGLTEVSLRADVRLRVAARWALEHPLGLWTSPWTVGR